MPDRRLGTDPFQLLRIAVHASPTATTVRLFGELDIASGEYLRSTLREAGSPPGGPTYLDLSELDFLDAAGLRVILEESHRLDGGLVIRRGPPRIQRLFSLTGLEHNPSVAAHRLGAGGVLRFESNVEFVRRLFEVFVREGAAAVAQLAPADVVWQPWQAQGAVLRGRDEFSSYWAGREPIAMTRPPSFTASGDDVVVRVELRLPGGAGQPLASLYQFIGGRLIRATSFEALEDVESGAA